jgi:hypothetical protein
METLLLITIILLVILLVLIIGVLILCMKFFYDLRGLIVLMYTQADKLVDDASAFRAKYLHKNSLIKLLLGVVSRRDTIKRLADSFYSRK